ncbi:hypothetical protein FNU79_17420 [Deinococcus detaillensis]|uniref:Uncharacterized protein n=1 Tax=Deinococcus detaillensis TaxID=2592048 RepID=A0A553UHX0_9DEIO|nr:hypothetical protein [Deinococcus detaillensis]TSA79814.1 hypothetical protein FNU79_17420 [Deinococcus detaillensis]
MPASKRTWLIGALVILGGLGVWWTSERRWSGPLYCIEKPGTLWNGVAALPAEYTPECPESRSYRQEVRSGLSRVERYRVDGWHPNVLLGVMKQAGYRQTTDDPIAPGNYAAFLTGQSGMIQYLANLQDRQTVVTLSGRP